MRIKKPIVLLAIFLAPLLVSAEERIREFDSFIKINKNATVDVVEEITYDFGANDRHGIFRSIPFKYKTSLGSYRAEITVDNVYMNDGQVVSYTVSRSGSEISIKIGDPKKLITGQHDYYISYSVKDVISYYKDFDELYWNVTGDGWSVPIDEVNVSVSLTGGGQFLQSACYQGVRGANTQCTGDDTAQNVYGAYEVRPRALSSYEGATVAVSFPKGLVYEPTQTERAIKTLKDNWILILPVLVFLSLLYLWYTRGKDPAGRGAIVPQYDAPEGLSPAEVSALFNERVSSSDISAELVYLAVRGYIKIHQIEKKKLIFTDTDYFLEKLTSPAGGEETLTSFQQMLLNKLFATANLSTETVEDKATEGVLLSDLHNTFYQEFRDIQKDIYISVTQKRYFVKSPKKVRTAYGVVGFVVLFASVFLGGFFQSFLTAVSMALSGIFIAIFSFVMPVKTKKGVLAKEYILGLRDYIHTAERDRIAFHNNPKNTPERFDTLLPYAMVLGVEKQWAKLFEDIYSDQPHWYTGAHSVFNTGGFVSDIRGFSSAAISNMSSAPSSSGSGGGGSSGGGFGGGGGGSW